jgi:predicted metal-dependent phosphoesterase TrpH
MPKEKTLNKYFGGKKYSDWLRIDLHIHTDKSKETKTNDYKGNFDVPTLKAKLIENQVGIFSLTDHNIINVEAYEEYYNS